MFFGLNTEYVEPYQDADSSNSGSLLPIDNSIIILPFDFALIQSHPHLLSQMQNHEIDVDPLNSAHNDCTIRAEARHCHQRRLCPTSTSTVKHFICCNAKLHCRRKGAGGASDLVIYDLCKNQGYDTQAMFCVHGKKSNDATMFLHSSGDETRHPEL